MNRRLRNYLQKEQISYYHQFHPPAETAKAVAIEEHISSRFMAKSVVIKADSAFGLAVLPASARLDLGKLKAALGAAHLRLASEMELTSLFLDCEIGAMPPFGNLYGLPVYCEASLAKNKEIIFNAGTHVDTLRIRFADFERLAQPRLIEFALNNRAA